jgi:hypothetical protein
MTEKVYKDRVKRIKAAAEKGLVEPVRKRKTSG